MVSAHRLAGRDAALQSLGLEKEAFWRGLAGAAKGLATGANAVQLGADTAGNMYAESHNPHPHYIHAGARGLTTGAGSLAGSVIGQALIPIPVVGGLIGGYIGGELGNWAGGKMFANPVRPKFAPPAPGLRMVAQ